MIDATIIGLLGAMLFAIVLLLMGIFVILIEIIIILRKL